MMRTIMPAVALCALLFLSGAAEAKKERKEVEASKIGYVDLNYALNAVGKKEKEMLEKDGSVKKQKLEIKQRELQKMKEEFDKQRLILSDEARREKEQKLQQGFVELQRLSMQFEKEFAEKEATLTRPIAEKLKSVIAEMGKSGEYAAIIPKEMILYAPSGTDLTEEIIKRYNTKK